MFVIFLRVTLKDIEFRNRRRSNSISSVHSRIGNTKTDNFRRRFKRSNSVTNNTKKSDFLVQRRNQFTRMDGASKKNNRSRSSSRKNFLSNPRGTGSMISVKNGFHANQNSLNLNGISKNARFQTNVSVHNRLGVNINSKTIDFRKSRLHDRNLKQHGKKQQNAKR